jgi:hypothetical protein
VSYKKSAIGPNFFTTRGKPPMGLKQVLNMPRPPPPYNSPAAWWNTPGPLQPLQHRAWECFTEGYDPIAQRWQPGGTPDTPTLGAGHKQLAAASSEEQSAS